MTRVHSMLWETPRQAANHMRRAQASVSTKKGPSKVHADANTMFVACSMSGAFSHTRPTSGPRCESSRPGLATAHDELRRPIRRLVTSLQFVNEPLGEHGGASREYCRRRTALHWNGLCGSDLVHGSSTLHRCGEVLRCMPICGCCKTPGAPSQFIPTPVTVVVCWSAGA